MKASHWRTPRPQIDTCSVQLRDSSTCGQPTVPHAPFPVCESHIVQAYRYVARRVGAAAADPIVQLQCAIAHVDERYAKRKRPPGPGLVYYVQVGDLIKIGYTTSLKQRLVAYPPNRRLLATEPGTRGDEQHRLAQFKHLLSVGHEWFRPEQDLIDHVNRLRKTAGALPIGASP